MKSNQKSRQKKHNRRKFLWFLWVPLILIGIILITLVTTFGIAAYSIEYGMDEYVIRETDISGLETFSVTNEYELVIEDSSLSAVRDKVNGYIAEILGSELPLNDTIGEKPYILLAVRPDLDADYLFVGDNINIQILGKNIDHVLRGSCAFLEEYGGLRCYTSKMLVATKNTIDFPKQTDGYIEKYNDYFEMRDTDWISPRDDDYAWFRGFNTDEWRYETQKELDETEEEFEIRKIEESAYYDSMGGRIQYIT